MSRPVPDSRSVPDDGPRAGPAAALRPRADAATGDAGPIPIALSAAAAHGSPVWLTPLRLAVLATLALLLAWPFLSDHVVAVLATIGLAALVAAGLVMLTGVAGVTSFGQAAFVGTGAYATAWVGTSPEVAQALAAATGGAIGPAALPWLGLALGLAVTFVLAWALGAVTLKLSGHYLPLGTLA